MKDLVGNNTYNTSKRISGHVDSKQNYSGIPWRRFFARNFDATIAFIITAWICIHAKNHEFIDAVVFGGKYSFQISVLLASMLIEITSLFLFGSTVGKYIFGVKINLKNKKKLPLGYVFTRCWRVIFYNPYFLAFYVWGAAQILEGLYFRKHGVTSYDKDKCDVSNGKPHFVVFFIVSLLAVAIVAEGVNNIVPLWAR